MILAMPTSIDPLDATSSSTVLRSTPVLGGIALDLGHFGGVAAGCLAHGGVRPAAPLQFVEGRRRDP
jgi:hypothetical protein